MGELAPQFAALNDDVLFGEVWAREAELSPRDRSSATVSALIGAGILDSSLKAHLQKALDNGVTRSELVEVITQLGFYAGLAESLGGIPVIERNFGGGRVVL